MATGSDVSVKKDAKGYYLRLKTGIVDGELHQRHFFQPWSGVIISEIKTVPPAVPYNHDVN